MTTIRFLLVGLGNLGRRFCEIVLEKEELLRERYDLELKLVGAADSRGSAYDPAGLELAEVVRLKDAGGTIADYPVVGQQGRDALALLSMAEAELLLEASPVNMGQRAEPGLSCVREALRRGWHVVTPNKGPLVFAFEELHELAAAHGVQLRFDGTVAGGLPALNLGCRDLRGATIERLEAVPNLTTGYVMDLLAAGATWEEARTSARDAGMLEGDGSWDLEGWDTAAKLTILANAVLDYPACLGDVPRVAVTELDLSKLRAAHARGERYRLLASAVRLPDGNYTLDVSPVAMKPTHPLGSLTEKTVRYRVHDRHLWYYYGHH